MTLSWQHRPQALQTYENALLRFTSLGSYDLKMKWRLLRGVAASLLRIAFLLYVALLAVGIFLSDRYIFLPRPSSYKDTPEFLKLTTEDGKKIIALYLFNPTAKFTLLVSHGNAEDLGDGRDWYEDLRRAGFRRYGI